MNIRARFSLCGSKIFSLKYPKIYFYMQLRIKEQCGRGKNLEGNRKKFKSLQREEY